ncbi:MAG: hypothetical protein Q9208_004746 [Pyrenodesmia sp. 3 TL-2023]
MPSATPTASLPQHQTAIVAQGPGKLAIQLSAPLPFLEPDMAIVKTAAVAINPADAKMLDYSAAPGAIHGYDFAGTIVAQGADALASGRLAVGDRVAGLVHGMNRLRPDVGAFAEYVGAYADLLLRIPDNMSFEEAATFGTGLATASLSLFSELGVPASLAQLREHQPARDGKAGADAGHREFVLVAGGSTATGTRAIQLVKLAGLRPIVTCSPSNVDLVLRFGAEKAFDYRSPTCAAEIRSYTRDELAYTLDCVSQADTTQLCYAAMGRAGGRYVSLEPFQKAVAQSRALTIEPSWVMVLTVFGRKVALEGEYGRDAQPQDRQFAAEAFAAVQSLLDRGLVETHPVKIMLGGWEGVMQGVDVIRRQALSGQKLVYPVL